MVTALKKGTELYDVGELDKEVLSYLGDESVLDEEGAMDIMVSTELSSYGYNDKDVYNLLDAVGMEDLPPYGSDEWEDTYDWFAGYLDDELQPIAEDLTQASQFVHQGGYYYFGWHPDLGGFGLFFRASENDLKRLEEAHLPSEMRRKRPSGNSASTTTAAKEFDTNQLSTIHPRDYTDEDQLAVVKWLQELPLKELRRRQDLNDQQIERAYKQRNDDAMMDLQMTRDLYMLAIDRQVFGEEEY